MGGLLLVVVLRTGGRGGDVGEGEVEVDPWQGPGVEGVEAGYQPGPVWSVRSLNNEILLDCQACQAKTSPSLLRSGVAQ